MRSLLTALLGLALLVPVVAHAGSPTSSDVTSPGSLVEVTISQTAALAAAGIDTTVAIDMRDVAWWIVGDGTALGSGSTTLNDGTLGDSLSIVVQSSVDGTVWTADVSAFVVNGQNASEQAHAVFGRFMRWILTNNDEDGHTYTVRVQLPRAAR